MNEDTILDVEQPVQDDNSISQFDSDIISNEVVMTDTGDTASDPEAETDGSAAVETVTEYAMPEYTTENPLPVILVEDSEEQTELEVYSLTGTYNGTISDTYLDYFEGIVQKLMPGEHYVIWRSGQYAYTMCYGENIALDGAFFSGECNKVEVYRSSDSYSSEWYTSVGTDSLALSATDIFCYSDLGMYPTVERGLSHAEGIALLVAICVLTVYVLCHSLFDYIVKHIYRK